MTPKVLVATSLDQPVLLDMWHQRFGHAGLQSIRRLVSKQLVDRLHIQSKPHSPGMCKDCIYGRQTTRPYDGTSENVQITGEKVYINLWGPATVVLLGGAVYLIVFTDAGSSRLWGAYLANKASETTLSALKNYVMEAERQMENKLKTIQIDGGREWVNHLWNEYCNEMGIVLKPVVPYAHAQNGVVERSIRTIFDGVRCLLAESGLPKSLWAEAAATIIYTQNLLPSIRHPDLVPEEKWLGKRQDVGHLCSFGCIGYARVPKKLIRSKLDSRSVKYVMVGYSSHGYRLYDRVNRLIVTSQNVIFKEGSGHRTIAVPDDNDLESSVPVYINSTTPPVLAPRQQIVPRIRHSDGPLHPDSPITDNLPPAPRRSAWTIRPSHAILDAQESLAAQSAAQDVGKEWAAGDDTPEALCASTAPFAFLASTRPDDMNVAPRSYWEAMKRPDLWVSAMDAELDVMERKDVWKIIDVKDVPSGKKIVDCMWVYTNKYNGEGEIVKRKACLVAKSCTQVQGEDFDETYTSIVCLESMRMTVAVTAALGMHLWQVDFVSAYLNSKLEHTVYMRPPAGFCDGEGKALHLQKTLYGLMQGGHNWWHNLDRAYDKLGYLASHANSCVRYKQVGNEHTIMDNYNDDVLGASTTVGRSQAAKKELGSKFEAKDMGELQYILGVRFDHDPTTSNIHLSQRAYLERMLERFSFCTSNTQNTPLPAGLVLTESQSPQTEEDRKFMLNKPFRKALGSLMWAQAATCPDLSFAVSLLAQFQSSPGPAHWKALAHVMQYVNGTLDYQITYRRGAPIKLVGYVDVDFGGDLDMRRSTGRYLFTMAGGAVSWSSKCQPTVALSTTEAEYMALTRGAQQAMWMHNWLLNIDLTQTFLAILHIDNLPALSLAQCTKGHARAKHIDIHHHYIRERVKQGEIEVIHIPSIQNPADLFTKPLGRINHSHLINLLGLRPQLESGGVSE